MANLRGKTHYVKAAIAFSVAMALILPGTAVLANFEKTTNNPLAYTMTAEDTTGNIGQNGLVVEITGSWDDTIQGYQVELEYDTTKLQYAGYDFTGTIADTYPADYTVGGEFSPGYVRVGAVWFPPVEDMPPAGSGPIAKVLFNVTATEETTTVIDLLDICVYTPTTGSSIYPAVTDGTVTIVDVQYVCGDADGNGIINISDAVFLISYIFGGGPAPDPLCVGDCDGNGIVNISDAVYLIAYIFGGGPAPLQSPGCPCAPV